MALPPVKGKWSRQQYINAHKFLRPFVNSNFNLNKRLSVGQKSAIRKAYREAADAGLFSNQLAELKRVPRLPRESRTAHRRRINQVKRAVSQTGRLLNAPVLALPRGTRVRFRRDGTIEAARPNRRERFLPLDKAAFLADPKAAVRRALEGAEDEYEGVQFLFGVNRSDTFALFDPGDFDAFLDYAEELGNDYADPETFVNGLIVSVAVDS